MADEMSDNTPTPMEMRRVAAFADGELEGEEHLQMLEKSQCCRETAARIRHQQQLRRACERVMMKQKEACDCPCALKERISALCADEACESTRSVLGRIGRWAPALVAAVLLLGVVYLYRDAFTGTGIAGNVPIETIIPVAQAERFNTRHATCSKSVDTLYNVHKYPGSLTALPQSVAAQLGTPVPALDLTSLGYRFAGAGDCLIPGTESVHLVYKADPASGHSDSVSLWMCPDKGDLPLAEGTIYTRGCPKSNHKLLIWKRGGVVYYLLGDEADRTEVIANSLQHTS